MGIAGDKKLVGALIIGKVSAMLATFAMPVILTRLLSKDDYGIYSQFFTISTFLAGFLSFGLSSNLYYFYPNASIEKKKTIVFQTCLMLIIIAVLSPGLLLIPFLGKQFMGAELLIYKNILMVVVFLTIPSGIIETLYVLKGDKLASVAFPPITIVSKVISIILFIMVANNLNSVFNAVLFSQIFISLLIIWYISDELGFKNLSMPKIDFKLWKEQLSYSIPFGIAASINALLGRFDKLVCISFLTSADYATYSVAFFGIPAISQIYDSFSQVYIVKMTGAWQNGNRKEMLTIYNDLVSKTYSYTVPLILAFSLYAPKIVKLIFTVKYIDAVPLFRLYILSFFFVLLGTGLILRAAGETKKILYSYLIGCLISLPITYFLIRNVGLYGAMSGAILSLFAPKFFMIFSEMKMFNCTLKQYLPWNNFIKIFIISSLVIFPFIIMEWKWNISIPMTILFGIVYILVVSYIEMRFDLFVVSYDYLKNRKRKSSLRFKFFN